MAFNYYSGVVATALATGVSSGDTDLSVDDGSTYPDPAAPGYGPYKILVGYETSREEACLVTAKPSANVLRVTRAQDSTPATAKNAGDVVVVGSTAADLREINLRLPLSGGTMTGKIVLDGAPTAGSHPATKTYVDTADGLLLPKAGGTMTGALTLSGAPTVDLHASTKKYVDDAIVASGAFTSYTPTLAQGTATNISKTVNYSRFVRVGDRVRWTFYLTSLGAGVAGSSLTLTLPVSASAPVPLVIGNGEYHDVGGLRYPFAVVLASGGTINIRRTDTNPSGNIGSDPSIAVAASDVIAGTVEYEVA